MYQIGDIAKQLGLPESTVRTWRDQFEMFVPGTGQGRSRRFSEEELEIFLEITHYKQQRLTVPEITDRLANRHAIEMTQDGAPAEPSSANLPQIIMQMATHMAQLQRRIDELEQTQQQGFAEITDSLTTTREEILAQLREQSASQEKVIQQRDQEVLQQLQQWRDETMEEREHSRKPWWPFGKR